MLANIFKKSPQVNPGVRKKQSATATSHSSPWRTTKAEHLRSSPLATAFEDPEEAHKGEHNTTHKGQKWRNVLQFELYYPHYWDFLYRSILMHYCSLSHVTVSGRLILVPELQFWDFSYTNNKLLSFWLAHTHTRICKGCFLFVTLNMLIGKVQRQCLGEDERKRTDLGEEETVKDKRRKEESFVFNKK